MGKEVLVDVIGVVPPCKRCDAMRKNAETAASALRSEGVDVKMNKLDIISKDVISRYGAIMSPALALNGKLKIMGRVPDAKEIEALLREAAK